MRAFCVAYGYGLSRTQRQSENRDRQIHIPGDILKMHRYES